MAGTVYRVDGGREIRRALRRAGPELLDELKAEHGWLANFVEQRAEALAPRRTGRLAGTMRSSGTRTMATVRAGRAAVPYAGPVHWGWPARHIPANPWIALAAQRTEPQWAAHYEQALRRLMERASNG